MALNEESVSRGIAGKPVGPNHREERRGGGPPPEADQEAGGGDTNKNIVKRKRIQKGSLSKCYFLQSRSLRQV